MTALHTEISPQDFMAQPPDPEEVEAYADPLSSIADSLRQLVDRTAVSEPCGHLKELTETEQELLKIEALHDAKQALIEQVLEICKPSTSKLADRIRAVLEPVVEPAEPAP